MFNRKLKQQLAAVETELAELRTARNETTWPSNWESWQDLIAPTPAGVHVNAETAMSTSAVYACVRLLAGAVAGLPLPIYVAGSTERERATSHPAWRLLNVEADARNTAAVFWEYLTASVLLHGDAFAWIERDRNGQPRALHALPPALVEVREAGAFALEYFINAAGQWRKTIAEDMIHIPGVGFNGLRGMNPIRYAARQAVGLSLAAGEYSERFFGSGTNPDVVLKAAGKMDADQVAELRRAWAERYSGLKQAHKPLVLTQGLDVSQLSLNAADAQLLESRRFQVVDIARIYGVPPHMIGETSNSTSWGAGIEQLSIGFVQYTLQPHLKRAEQELNRKLFPRGRYFVEFNVTGLLRGDSKTRAEYYARALGGSAGPGWMTQNEVRRLENLSQREDGNELTRWTQDDEPAGTPPADDDTDTETPGGQE